MRNLITRFQIWNYWRKTYANYECFNWIYKIKVLLGITNPLTFRVLAPAKLYTIKVEKLKKKECRKFAKFNKSRTSMETLRTEFIKKKN